MADFTKDILAELKESNKRLAILEKQGIEDDSPKEIIKQAIPEVLAERKYSFMEPKKLGLFKVDNYIKEQSKKQEEQHKGVVQALNQVAEKGDKLNETILPQFHRGIDEWNRLDLQKRHMENEERKKELEELKLQLETLGRKAEDNREYNKLSYKIQKEELAIRKKAADSPAARKEIKEEQRALAKKQENLQGRILRGINFMGKKMSEKVKGAGRSIWTILKGTLLAGFLVALLAFLESDTWKKWKKWLVDEGPKLLEETYNAFFDKDRKFRFFKGLKNIAKKLGLIDSEINDLADSNWGISAAIVGIGAGLVLLSKVFTGIRGTMGRMFPFLAKPVPKVTTSLKPGQKGGPPLGGPERGKLSGRDVVRSAIRQMPDGTVKGGNWTFAGAGGKATTELVPKGDISKIKSSMPATAPAAGEGAKPSQFGQRLRWILRRIPLIGYFLGANDLLNIVESDDTNTEKTKAIVKLLGSLGGSAVGAIAGTALGVAALGGIPIISWLTGAFTGMAGGILGYYFGGEISKALAQWMLGDKITAFDNITEKDVWARITGGLFSGGNGDKSKKPPLNVNANQAMLDIGGMGGGYARVHATNPALTAAAAVRMKVGGIPKSMLSEGNWAYSGNNKEKFMEWMENKFLDPTPGTGIKTSDIDSLAKQFKNAEDWMDRRDQVAKEITDRAIEKARSLWMKGSDTTILNAPQSVNASRSYSSVVTSTELQHPSNIVNLLNTAMPG
tara:strand:- start:42 stop:2237 length:2196 start_codon:yes stop_codon:yes gene_type:complete